ncbi:MAG TPA: stage III sporulation protein AE [Candidatus Merdenecus merdavium]|nr:stage III sporulation protein AE [Candidatus Merdenecus merdavium]
MKKIILVISLLIYVIMFQEIEVFAEEDTTQSIMDSIDFYGIDESLEELLKGQDLNFQDMVVKIMKGDLSLKDGNLGSILLNSLFSGALSYKDSFIHIILIVIIAAIFTNFSNIFKSTQIAEVSFYIIYLLLFTVLITSFKEMAGVVTQALDTLLTFMKVLVPAYFLAIAFSTGGTTAMMFYEFTFLMITVVQWLLLHVVIPAVNMYVTLTLVNHISKEDFLSKLADLMKKSVKWMLKSMFAAVVGINVIQGLIAPAIDAVKSMAITKTASSLPGIGNALNAMTELVLGSAVLIKNSIGVAALIVILLLCAAPVVKLAVSSFLYHVIEAVLQPISEKRMLECIHGVGEGIGLLLKVLTMAAVLFLVTIAMISVSTSR